MEFAFGAGGGNVEEAPLFGAGVGALGESDRDVTVFDADQVHDRPFESLGRMEGAELDAIGDGGDTIVGAQRREEVVDGGAAFEFEVPAGDVEERLEYRSAFFAQVGVVERVRELGGGVGQDVGQRLIAVPGVDEFHHFRSPQQRSVAPGTNGDPGTLECSAHCWELRIGASEHSLVPPRRARLVTPPHRAGDGDRFALGIEAPHAGFVA